MRRKRGEPDKDSEEDETEDWAGSEKPWDESSGVEGRGRGISWAESRHPQLGFVISKSLVDVKK